MSAVASCSRSTNSERVVLAGLADAEEWRTHARALLARGVEPHLITWSSAGDASEPIALVAGSPEPGETGTSPQQLPPRVPREFLVLAGQVVAHRDPQRFALLYRALWRIGHGEPRLLDFTTDPDVQRLRLMAQAVRRDSHKMKAFVRFREIRMDCSSLFVAWFEPDHYIVDRVAPFFMRRYTGMHFSILTPVRSVHWDGESLSFGAGVDKSLAPHSDAMEGWWRTYYASIFNEARLNVRAMQAEMPQKYWRNLPEAAVIGKLVQRAPPAVQSMLERPATTARRRIAALRDTVGEGTEVAPTSVESLRLAARGCRRCPLWKPATQTVFGEGPRDAQVIIIGEQPGDQEDLSGRPFVGPAGKLFDRALADIGVARASLYITNTVKHFKFEARGRTRLHQRANAEEQAACRAWLDAEIETIGAPFIVCLGAMASRAVLGATFRLMQERGNWRHIEGGLHALATVHPAYLLRLPEAEKATAYADFVRDLDCMNRLPGN